MNVAVFLMKKDRRRTEKGDRKLEDTILPDFETNCSRSKSFLVDSRGRGEKEEIGERIWETGKTRNGRIEINWCRAERRGYVQ